MDEKALEAHRRRMEDFKGQGRVTTHLIGGSSFDNRRGGRPSKFGNIKAEAEGFTFSSKKEKARWMDLRLEERAGAIKDLKRQVVYPLEVNGMLICDYIADMVYERNGLVVCEDAKGFKTPEYKLKAKLMLACHGVEILET